MMKRAVTFALLATAGTMCVASAQTPPREQRIVRAGSQPSTQGPEHYFTGKVRVDPVFAASADVPYSAADVTFEPGARSAWHTHPAGQRLIVTGGVARTSATRSPSSGSASSGWLADACVHVSGKSVEWMEEIRDEQCNRR